MKAENRWVATIDWSAIHHASVFDVGTKDESGHHEFNPPSLRGIAQRDGYFHDNRAATLADVFRKHRHQLPRTLSDEELKSLVAFLQSL